MEQKPVRLNRKRFEAALIQMPRATSFVVSMPTHGGVYILVDQATHEQAMEALQRLQNEDEPAIQQGIEDMEAGRGMALNESRARTNETLARLSQ